ncbi:MAG: MMPL family transporter [Hyphomicrobiaceae bacterium]|nr:MMPL family transporter [Hyphomicrobiaceae bacterium]MCC0022823.1 MMPL family transporter [Hyphomicrobiaceae bacterium]
MQGLFERWGAFVARHPLSILLVAILIFVAGLVGLLRLTTANGVQQFFVGSSEVYQRYEAMSALFPSSQMDAVLVVSDPELMTPARLEALRDLSLDLSLEDGVANVVSLFSARQAGPDGETFPPLVPPDIPQGDAFSALVGQIIANPLVHNRLLSSDGTMALFNVRLDPAQVDRASFGQVADAFRKLAADDLGPVGLTAIMTGAPVIRAELDAINAREQLLLIFAGLLVGGLVSLAYFRRLSLVLISGTVPIATIVITFGLLGWLQIPISISLQIVAPLVIFIAFNNAMHVLFAILHGPKDPDAPASAVVHAIAEVGPASLMTSLTSAIAFVALLLAPSDAIRAFGALAAFGTMLAFVAVVTIVPALTVLTIRFRGTSFLTKGHAGRGWVERTCFTIDQVAGRHPKSILAAGLVLFAVFAYAQTTLTPRYLLSDNVPFQSESRVAIKKIDAALGGSQPLRIIVRWPAHDPVAEAVLIDKLRETETRLASFPAIGSVLSLATLSDWLATGGGSADDLDALLEALPDSLTRGMIDRDAGAALITAMVPDQSTDENRQLIGAIETDLVQIASASPGFTFEVTGIVALTATETGHIIGSLQISLFAAIIVIITLIGITFRQLWPAIISILPNVFPISVGGAFLAAQGGDLNFAGAIAMTVAFGLAVDDTIHMLYRFRAELAKSGSVEEALQGTISKIAPVLVVSSLVLITGIAVLFLSDMPMNQGYARLTIVIFIAALVGDLVLLPALLRVFRGRLKRSTSPVNR